MVTTLTKGANTSLTASHPDLQRVLVGLGWTLPSRDFQLDLSVLLCGPDAQVPSPDYVVFASQVDAVERPAGTTTERPAGTDDAEQLEVDLAGVPGYIARIVFAASIYDAGARRQTFGQIEQLYIRVADLASEQELVRYTLDHDCAGETALAFAELYRHPSGWKFRAIGQGWSNGLAGLAHDYGAQTR